MPAPPSSSLRILCFGASITAGFHSFGLAPPHPYAHRLQHHLSTSLPPAITLTISIDAVPGDRIIGGDYDSRLRRHFPASSFNVKAGKVEGEEGSKYDWIILQAGGNDLASGHAPEDIFAALTHLWDMCTGNSAQVLALTVTETSAESKLMKERYARLNAMIRAAGKSGVWVADVEREVPYWGMEAGKRRRVWDDGLHFKPEGYDLLGEKVGGRLLEILREERGERRGKL
ncbi:MAG: hypothetical protein LQ345_003917 [Seirophora villosa]|nr:MAG: hypothetical protein LQ345_003917 [Seirophora villosa]